MVGCTASMALSNMRASGAMAVQYANMENTKLCVPFAAGGVFVRMEISDADAERAARLPE